MTRLKTLTCYEKVPSPVNAIIAPDIHNILLTLLENWAVATGICDRNNWSQICDRLTTEIAPVAKIATIINSVATRSLNLLPIKPVANLATVFAQSQIRRKKKT